MVVFYIFVIIIVVIAIVRVQNATGEVKDEPMNSEVKERKQRKNQSPKKEFDFWWFPGESGGSDGGGFEGGSSHGGDGSSTGF